MPLWKSAEEKELERKIKAKEGKRRIERYVQEQRKNITKYWEYAKRAARLKDEKTFERCAAVVLMTQQNVNRWERALLAFDVMKTEYEQALAMKGMADAYAAMAQSILKNSNPAEMAKIQRDVQRAQGRAEALDMMMEEFLDMSESALDEVSSGESSAELKQMMAAIRAESEHEEQGGGAESDEIAASLRAVEDLLKPG